LLLFLKLNINNINLTFNIWNIKNMNNLATSMNQLNSFVAPVTPDVKYGKFEGKAIIHINSSYMQKTNLIAGNAAENIGKGILLATVAFVCAIYATAMATFVQSAVQGNPAAIFGCGVSMAALMSFDTNKSITAAITAAALAVSVAARTIKPLAMAIGIGLSINILHRINS
jgi:hypothetical protein